MPLKGKTIPKGEIEEHVAFCRRDFTIYKKSLQSLTQERTMNIEDSLSKNIWNE